MSVDEKTAYQKLSPAQKEKWFGEERNARRRDRYHNDPAYRKQVLERTRKARAKARKQIEQQPPVSVTSISQLRLVRAVDHLSEVELKCLTKGQLVKALNISPMTFSRWLSSGVVPRPGLYESSIQVTIDSRHAYYSISEARFLMKIFTRDAKSSTRNLRKLILSGEDVAGQMIAARNKDVKEALNV